jgi:hypothetical protein
MTANSTELTVILATAKRAKCRLEGLPAQFVAHLVAFRRHPNFSQSMPPIAPIIHAPGSGTIEIASICVRPLNTSIRRKLALCRSTGLPSPSRAQDKSKPAPPAEPPYIARIPLRFNPLKSAPVKAGFTGRSGFPVPSVGNNVPTFGAKLGSKVNQVDPSALASTRVETVLVNIAPDVSALEPLPLVTTKNELPKIIISIPYGFTGLLMIGVLNRNVSDPPAPIDTIWVVENGGANGVIPLPDAGAPNAALEFVKFGLKPLPGLYETTPLANCA